jgi:RHS repeat-associated protein
MKPVVPGVVAMRVWVQRSLLLVSCCLLGAVAVAAETEPIAGPITVVRGNGQPCEVERQVILPTPAAAYTLRVDNDAAHPVTSADIRLGSQTVVSERDFTAGVTRIEKPVTAGGAVEIGALLRGAPGSTLRISLRQSCCWTTLVFGPERFNRTNGSPNVYSRTIAGHAGSAILRLVNGDGQGTDAVSSATITIDGQQVFTPPQFNQQVHTLSVPITLAASSTLRVELRSSPGSYLTLSILSQDCRPLTASFATATSEATEGGAQPAIAVVLNRPSPQPITLPVSVNGGTATLGTDATLAATTVTIPAGVTSAPVPVQVVDDVLAESDETLILTLGGSSSGGGCHGGDGHCGGGDDGHDGHGCDRDRRRGASAGHDDRDRDHRGDADRQNNGHGGEGDRSTRKSSTAQGHGNDQQQGRDDRQGCVTGNGNHDGHGDGDHHGGGSCGGGTSTGGCTVTIGTPSTHTLTIHDNDQQQQVPTVAFALATSSVGEAAAPLAVTVALSQVAATDVVVPLTVTGTATIGVDAQAIPTSLTIPAGSLSAAISIAPINDALHEGDETVVLTLGAPAGATLGAVTTHTATIVDDDAVPVIGFVAATSQVGEAAGGLAIEVLLDHASINPVSVTFTVTGTATIGTDVQALPSALSIPAGSTSGTITLTTINDQIHEGDETVVIALGAPTNATIGTPGVHTATIVDDDAMPVISFVAATSQVGEAAGGIAITVQLDRSSVSAVTVPLTVTGTATIGTDVQALPIALGITAGSTSGTITLTPINDQIHEGDETVIITLGAPTNATLGTPGTHTVAIIDDDAVPVLRFAQSSSSQGEAAGAAAIAVVLDHPAATAISATITTTGTAGIGSDVQAIATAVSIPAGAVSGTITVTPIDDLLHEADETVVLTLSAPEGATLGSPAAHTLTILDNDPLPSVAFTTATSSLGEAAAPGMVTISLSQATSEEVTVLLTAAGTASVGADYQAVVAQVTIPAGTTAATVAIAPVDDQTHEGDETVVLTLGAPTGALLGAQTTHTATIVDDDPVPAIRFVQAASSVGEADGAVAIQVSLDRPSTATVTATVTVAGTAVVGSDVQTVVGSITVPAGATAATITVTPIDDQIHEGDETVVLTLSAPIGATLGAPASHTLTVVDNDPVPAVAFAVATASVGEAAAPIAIQIVLDRPSVDAVTVPMTVSGTATSGSDYQALVASVTVPAGATTAAIALAPLDDQIHEGDETVVLALGAPTGATLGALTTHTATILDNDAIPSVAFGPVPASISEAGAPLGIAVRLSHATVDAVSVTLLGGGSATAGADYQNLPTALTIPAGSLETVLTLTPIDDQVYEGDETVALTLANPAGAVLGAPATAAVTISDDDAVPSVTFDVASSTVAEAAVVHAIGLHLDRASATPVVVTLAQSGSAVVGSDIQAVAATVTIPAGATAATVAVTVLNDALPEATDTVVLTITAATGATPGAIPAHILSITDSDSFALVPILECVEDNLDGTFTAFFGYQNDGARIGLFPGLFNNVRAGDDNQGQAVIFPGSSRSGTWPDVALAMVMPGEELVWTLGTATAAARRDSPRPPAPPGLVPDPQPPVARIAQPANGSVVVAGVPVVILIDSYDTDGLVRQVRLTVDGVDLSVQTPVPGQMTAFTLTAPTAGSHALSVLITDDQNLTASATGSFIVGIPPTVVLADASDAPLLVGATARVLATADDADGNLARVEFYQGDTLLGTAVAAPYALDIPGIAGNLAVTAVAIDSTGLRGSASLILLPDRAPTVAITAPASGALVTPIDGKVTLVAQASDSDGTIGNVRFLVDGQDAGTVATSPYRIDWTVGAATTLTVSAIATDNRGATATAVPVTVRINKPPTVTVVSPTDQSVVQVGDRLSVRVAASDSDGVVLGLILLQDGQRVAETKASELTQEFPTDAPVSYTFQAEAIDDLGAYRASALARVRVNAPPVASITAPISGATVQAGATVAATATVSDADGTIASAEWWLDGRLLSVTSTNAPAYTWTAEPGVHQLELRVQDNDRAVVRSAVTIVVNEPPVVEITAPADAEPLPNTGTVHLTARGSDADGQVVRMQVSVDGVDAGQNLSATLDRDLTIGGRGAHTIVVTATDDRGVSTSATRSITLVNVPPAVAISAPAAGSRVRGDQPLAVTISGSDIDGTVASLRLAVAETATGPFTVHGTFTTNPATDSIATLTPGATIYLRAEATDAEGAVGVAPVIPVVVNVPPVAALLQPIDGTVVVAGAELPLHAIGEDGDGHVRRLEVREGAAVVTGIDVDQAQAAMTGTWQAPAGVHQIRAAATDDTGETGLSAVVGVRVDAPPTIRWLAPASAADLNAGSAVTLTVEAIDPDGGPVRVVFTVDGQRLAVVDAAPYTTQWSPSGGGVTTIVATATDALGQSASATLTVTRYLPPTVVITAPTAGTGVAPGDTVAITATAASTNGALTGVEFLLDGQPLSTDSEAPYTATWTAVGVGTHNLQARTTDARGLSAVSAPVAITVVAGNLPPVIALQVPTAVDQGVAVPLTVAASDPDGSVARVRILIADVAVGDRTSAPWEFTWTPATPGVADLVVEAIDDRGAVARTEPVTVTVRPANVLPVVRLTTPQADGVIPLAPLTVTAEASDADGSVVAVRFLVDGVPVAQSATAPYTATITPAAAGPFVLSATVADDRGAITTSATRALTVDAPPVVAWEAVPGMVTIGQPITLAATASDPEGSTPRVAFTWVDGSPTGTALGVATAAPYQVSWLPPGTGPFTLRATATDAIGQATSAEVVLTLYAPPTVSLTAPIAGTLVAPSTVVSLSATAADVASGVTQVRFLVDGVVVATAAAEPWTGTWTAPAGNGSHVLVAEAVNSRSLVGRSAPVSISVGAPNAPPTVAITSPTAGTHLRVSGLVNVVATASDSDGTVARLVLLVNGTAVTQATGAPWSLFWTPTAAGAASLTIEATDDQGAVTVSAPVSVSIDPANTAPRISLAQPLAGAVLPYGQVLAITALPIDDDGQVSSVAISVVGSPLATLTAAPWTASWTPTGYGPVTVTALATDDQGLTATATATVVIDAPPSISWVEPASGSQPALGAPITLRVNATDPEGGALCVVFWADGAVIGTVAAAPYAVTWQPAGPGVHTLSATVSDALGQTATATATLTWRQSPVVAVSAPVAGALLQPDSAITISATATDASDTISQVRILVDGAAVATLAAPPWSTTWTPTGNGTRVITAEATNASGLIGRSTPVSVTVGGTNTLPVVAITAPAADAALPVSTLTTVTVTASDADGSVAQVVLRAGTTVIGTATAAPWTFPWTPSAIGSVDLVAEATDDRGAIVTSTLVTVRVTGANSPPTVAITAPVGLPKVVAGLALAITATAADIDGTVTTVRVLLDDQPVTEVTAAPWQASITPTVAGTHQIRVEAVDNLGAVGTSPPLTIIVEARDPTPGDIEVVVTAPDDGTTVAQNATVRLTAEVFNRISGITWLGPNLGPVNDGPGPVFAVSEVGFYVDGALVGTDPTEPYAIPWLAATTGTHEIVARAATTIGSLISLPITITVAADNGQAPTVAITSPASDGTVVGIDDILGTVLSTNPAAPISRWELAMLDGSGARLATVASATGAVTAGGTLGRLDTSLLRNGVYYLTLVANDRLGRESQAQRVVRVEGEAKPGNFAFTVQDAAVEVEGLTLTIARSYDTLERLRSLDHGYGWRSTQSDLAIALSETREDVEDAEGNTFSLRTGGRRDVTLTLPDGRRATFYATFEPAGALPGIITQRPAWTASDAVQETLTFSSRGVSEIGGSDLVRTFVDLSGNPLLTYWEAAGAQSTLEGFDIPAWNLTQPDGTRYEIDREQLGPHLFVDPATGMASFEEGFGKPYLARIVRPNGDQVEFGGDRVAHRVAGGSARTVFLIVRDGAGRIAQVWDPIRIDDTGAAVGDPLLRYTYDNSGDLVAVAKLADTSVTPTVYETTRYYYEEPRFPHYLTRIVDPTGKTVLEAQYDAQGRLTGVKDATGTVTVIAHDITARREQITDRTGRSKTLVYDAKGRVTDEYDGLGNHTHHEFDSHGNETRLVDAEGNVTTTEYQYSGNVIVWQKITDALGNFEIMTFDGAGRLLTHQNKNGQVTTNQYDGRGNLMSTTDALNRVTSSTYDSRDRVTSSTDEFGNVTSFGYDAKGRLALVTDARGTATFTTYDRNGNPIGSTVTRTLPEGGTETLNTTTSYDAQGRVTSVTGPDGATTGTSWNRIAKVASTTDALGNVTSFAYDSLGQLQTVSYPDGTSETTTYDADGRVLTRTGRNGLTASMSYDAAGRLQTTTAPGGATTSTDYFRNGWVKTVTEATGIVTTNTYDPVGRRTAVAIGKSNGIQVGSSSGFDPVGNLISATDGRNNTTQFAYDAINRQTVVTNADSTTRTTRYETWTWSEGGRTRTGEQRATVDELGATTLHRSDELGRLVQVVDALNQTTRYSFDEVGNQLTQTDALGRTTWYSTDAAGRRVRRTLPGGASEQLVYDRAGRLTERTDFKGQVTAFSYDSAGRLLERRPDPLSGEPAVSFTYTADGRRATMQDGFGQTLYGYDPATGRLLSVTNPVGSLAYGYDPSGRLLSITSGRGTTATYTFDDAGRLATAAGSAATGTVSFGYDAAGNQSSVAFPNGVTTSYGFDNRNRLSTVTSQRAGTGIASYAYGYDNAGRRTSANEHRGRDLTWTYDTIGRLTQEVITSTLGDAGTVGYGFDAVGNRLTRSSSVPGVATRADSFTVDDRLASDGYDANGNTVRSSQGNDAYTTEDRIRSRNRPDGTVVSIAYDGDGVKVAETVGGVTTWFLVDQQNPTGYSQTIEEIMNGAVVRSYLWGQALAPLAQTGAEGVRYFGTDGHGSVRYLTDALGTVTDSIDYDAYGIEVARTGSTDFRNRYSGYEIIPSLGIHYLRARMYNANAGRFMVADKWPGTPYSPQSNASYGYIQNSPLNGIDPSGYTPMNPNGLNPQGFGYAAEDVIYEDYVDEHPGDWINRKGGWARLMPFPFMKPDILNYTQESYAEIKPFSVTGVAAGRLQMVQRAIQFAIVNAVNGYHFHEDLWPLTTSEPVRVGLRRTGERVVYFNDGTGLIYYLSPFMNAAEAGLVAALSPAVRAAVSGYLRGAISYVVGAARGLAVRGAAASAARGEAQTNTAILIPLLSRIPL